MDVAVAVVAGLLVAGVAFRRARGLRTPEARREAARQARRELGGQARRPRRRRIVTGVLAAARAGVGVAALVGIVWLAVELFT